jgi:hypothetical protein
MLDVLWQPELYMVWAYVMFFLIVVAFVAAVLWDGRKRR